MFESEKAQNLSREGFSGLSLLVRPFKGREAETESMEEIKVHLIETGIFLPVIFILSLVGFS